ncbi:MAG: SIS domain-containing protein [Bacteroidaceae bacterium]|nr:SIS domain-containing protein [Bacteroidaceae bacterium]
MKDSIKELIEHEAKAILNIPIDDEYENAVNLIVDHVHKLNGKLITSGMGKAGQIAMNMATTFCSTGTPSVFLHPSEAQHGDLGVVQKNDIFLLISNSGKTREILELVELSKQLDSSLKFIVITSKKNCQLAKLADVVLTTGAPEEVCALGLAPTTSTTVMNVIGDILVVETMKKIGFTIEQYNKRHHGGYLGQRSKKLL